MKALKNIELLIRSHSYFVFQLKHFISILKENFRGELVRISSPYVIPKSNDIITQF
jgi:hypothetical protein